MPLATRSVAARATAIAGAAGAVAALAAMVLRSPRLDWDSARLAHSVALLTDGRFYAAPDTGVVLGTYYGPVATAFFVPAALVGDPAWGVVLASAMAALAFVVPLFLWPRAEAPTTVRLAIGASFVLGALAISSLRASSTQVHADAPTLALALLACILVAGVRASAHPARTLAIAGLLAALAVGTKQTMLPVLVALPVWLLVRESAKGAAAFVAGAGITLALGVGFLAARGELAAAWFHAARLNVAFPSSSSASPESAVAMALAQVWAPALIVGARWWVGSQDARARGASDAFGAVLPTAVQILLLVAIAELPAAMAGRMKLGGADNTLSPFSIFVWHAGLVALAGWPPSRRREQGVLAFAALLVAGMAVARPAWSAAANAEPVEQTIAGVAAAHERTHPGETWFAMNPAPASKIGGRPTHFLAALSESADADRSISHAQFWGHLPPRAVRACIPSATGAPYGALEWMRLRLKTVRDPSTGGLIPAAQVVEPSLPGWFCLAITRPTAAP